MRLYAMDAWVADTSVLVDGARLRAILEAAAARGSLSVLEQAFHVFPNGAVTGVLVLAQSHLSVHTWPERRLANVDLLSCGDVDGHELMEFVGRELDATRCNVACLERGR
jgi:S-adenosylmethionine decarboxylase